MNWIQFQPGLSMVEFMRRFGTQEQCEAALSLARWPQGFACPGCGGSSRTFFCRQGRLYRQCRGCQSQCSVTSGTVFENTKLPLTVWFLAMHLLTQAKNNVAGPGARAAPGRVLLHGMADQAQDYGGHA